MHYEEKWKAERERKAFLALDDGTVLLGYCAYSELGHSRLVKVPIGWFYGE